ncbi:hypothetical protein SBOR_7665 [Sclerotinia borealis F-4128]|uniref:Uncharacterized protein n=1 Tax=Sclerotinia borealis (strain F-4128) TaxID=1432307 RepID=W9C7X5_SCLBF|nr:hypothetical protein SBOR_7665 [Sclerotinia borealis F-4128]
MSHPTQNRISVGPPPRRKQYNILFLGNAGAGKASIKNRIIYNEFLRPNSFDPFEDDGDLKIITVDSEQCIVKIVELNYNKQHPAIREMSIRQADGVILMYSICSPSSFSVLESLWTSVKLVKIPEKKGLYVDIVGTMSDLWEKRTVMTEDGKLVAERLNCGFSECSAKEGENCEGLIEDLVRKIGVGREQERLLRDAKRRKEDDEREERDKKKNGVVKRVVKRCVEIMTMGT